MTWPLTPELCHQFINDQFDAIKLVNFNVNEPANQSESINTQKITILNITFN